MPTITHYALDPFLETGSPAQTQKAPPPIPPCKATEKPIPVPSAPPARTQTSPALYATPESTSLPDSPSSFLGTTWSPYLINHKRRGPSLAKTFSLGDCGSESSQPKVPVMLPPLPKRTEAIEVPEPEFAFQQVADGQSDSHSGVEENLAGRNGMLQKVSITATNHPEFEFQHGSLDTLVTPVNVARPMNGGTSKNGEGDTLFELQDSQILASYSETDDAAAHERWWKPSSPLGTSTPGAEFYDAFEGTYQLVPIPKVSNHLCSNAALYWEAFFSPCLPCFYHLILLQQHQ
jgi:hypothetical protein